MIEHQPTSVQERIYMDRFVGVFSPCEGVFDYQVNMGDEVEKGSVLGVVRDYGGNVIAEIPAPEYVNKTYVIPTAKSETVTLFTTLENDNVALG